MHKTYSLHKIYIKGQFTFEPDEYSEFKYGNGHFAKKFGMSLAKGFITTHGEELKGKQIVVLSSPYSFIPTASSSMATHFIYYLNNWLRKNEQDPVQISKIDREITYKDNYGNLSAEQRLSLIGNDSFYVDSLFLENKFLLFIDDIKITGSHQIVVERMIKQFGLKNDLFFLFFAELMNNEIHPKIENYLNNFKIGSLRNLMPLVTSKVFVFNTRVVKFILSNPMHEFIKFIEIQTEDFKYNLLHLAIGNGYHKMDEYFRNISVLEDMLLNRVKEIQV